MAKVCVAIAAVLAVAALLQTSVAETVHVVGDGLGWLVPPGGKIAYETWANMQTFVVGDVLGKHTGNESVLGFHCTFSFGCHRKTFCSEFFRMIYQIRVGLQFVFKIRSWLQV